MQTRTVGSIGLFIQMQIRALTHHGFEASAEVGIHLGLVLSQVHSALLLSSFWVGGHRDVLLIVTIHGLL